MPSRLRKVKGSERPRGGTRAMNRDRALLLAACALYCALALALVARDLERPGIYYDEVIQATPTLDFLRGEGRPAHVPGARTLWLFGGWFPLMTQSYMGALKSQLLLPSFALFGASPASLRLTTLGFGLLGLVLTIAWTRRVYGSPAALLTGLLLALDPNFLFIARHDWGSFSLGLALRGGALLLLTRGWNARSPSRIAAGGLCLGLGVYNKIDFAVFIVAAAIALLAIRPGLPRELRGGRRGAALAGLAGFALGAAPMLAAAGGALSATLQVSRTQSIDSPDWAEKWLTLTSVLDGSHFDRLMRAGGSFERLGEVTGAASGPGLLLFVAALVVLGVARWRRGAPGGAADFAALTALLTLIGIFLTPRAVRVHHFLNAFPFPQLVMALAAGEVWRLGASTRPAARVARPAAVLAVGLLVFGSLRIDLRTFETIVDTGGRGRWSVGRELLANDLARENARVVSLDWGFGGPLHFLEPALDVSEPFWALRQAPAPVALSEHGSAHHVYLVWDEPYAVFPFGRAFVEAVEALPPGSAEIRSHSDLTGAPGFRSIRLTRPHRVVYRGGRFSVELR